MPTTRWERQSAGGPVSSEAGVVSGVEQFDAGFFGVSAAEAAAVDPQQRMLLELGYEALHAALQRRSSLAASGVGVCAAIEHIDWQLLQLAVTALTAL